MSKDLDLVILKRINSDGNIDTYKLSKELDQDHQLFVGAVKRLQSLGDVCMSFNRLEILVLLNRWIESIVYDGWPSNFRLLEVF